MTSIAKSTSLSQQVAALAQVLESQLREYRALLECIEQKSEAIRHAQLEVMPAIFEKEHAIIERLAVAERTRIKLLQQLSGVIDSNATAPLRITQIAEALPSEADRERLLDIAEQLRSAATQAKERSSIVRAAADTLARHMSGVMQSVRSALTRAGVYEQKGRLAVGTQLDFSVDVRS